MNSNKYYFLDNLNLADIESVKKDIELINMGYDFVYIVDTFDIISYTLPFIKDNYFNDNTHLLADRAIIYEKVFTSLKSRLILAEEYRGELFSIKQNFLNKISGETKVKNNIEDIINKISKQEIDLNDKIEIKKFIDKNFNLLALLVTLSENGKNYFSTFFNLLKELQNFKIKAIGNIGDNELKKLFFNLNPTKVSENLYDEFVKESEMFLLSLDSNSDRYIYLENTFKDILVIDKVININSILNEKISNNKLIFMYLSSTPFKTSFLFSILKKNKIFKNLRDNENLHVDRNIYQIFLLHALLRIKKQKKSSISKIMNSILSLLKKRNNSEDFTIGKDKINTEEGETLSLVYDVMMNISDNIDNFLLSHAKTRERLINGLDKLEKEDFTNDIFDLLNKVKHYVNSKEATTLYNFDDYIAVTNIRNYSQTQLLIRDLSIRSFADNIMMPYGQDIIRNPFHHLPVLLFLYDYSEKDNLYELFDRITSSKNSINKNKNEISNLIRKVISSLAKSTDVFKKVNEEFLTFSFLNIILFPNEEDFNSNKKEKEISDVLVYQRKLLNDSTYKGLKYSRRDYNYQREINYLLLWLSRRDTQKIDDNIIFGKKYISVYDNDPRFYHGLGLAQTAKGYEVIPHNHENTINHFHDAVQNLSISLILYEEYMGKCTNDLVKKLLLKNQIAILNSISDIELKIYILEKNIELNTLIKVRKRIKDIKKIFKLIGEDYKDYPSINHTETELEYCEAKFYFKKGDINRAKEKISFALERIPFFKNYKDIYYPNIFNVRAEVENMHDYFFK